MTAFEGRRVQLTCMEEREVEKCQRRASLFVRGPLPMEWFARAASLPGRALDVGLLVWFRVGCEKRDRVVLRPSVRELFRLNRHAQYRALQALEAAGLVEVSRKSGAAPTVTLIRASEEELEQ